MEGAEQEGKTSNERGGRVKERGGRREERKGERRESDEGAAERGKEGDGGGKKNLSPTNVFFSKTFTCFGVFRVLAVLLLDHYHKVFFFSFRQSFKMSISISFSQCYQCLLLTLQLYSCYCSHYVITAISGLIDVKKKKREI